jgi:hypothetical protein
MARSTAHPDHQCISSEDIQGTEVCGAGGKNIGEIDHLIIDKVSGRVAYAVMSFGGFVGLGHSHYPIPWGALTYDPLLGGFRTSITEPVQSTVHFGTVRESRQAPRRCGGAEGVRAKVHSNLQRVTYVISWSAEEWLSARSAAGRAMFQNG